MDLRYTEHEEAFRGELREWLEGVVPALPAKPKDRRLGRAARVRHRVAADAVRRRATRGSTGRRSSAAGAPRPPSTSSTSRRPSGRGRPTWACNFVGLLHAGPTLIVEGSPEQKAHHLPAHPQGRAGVVPGLLRAERGLRPRQPAHARRARRRRLRAQRPEDLDQLRPRRRVLRDARAHESRPRGAQAGRDHLADRADGRRRASTSARCARWRAPTEFCEVFLDDVRVPVDQPRRRRERRLARRQRHPQLRAGHRVRRRRDGDRGAPARPRRAREAPHEQRRDAAGRTPGSGATSGTSPPSSTRSGR